MSENVNDENEIKFTDGFYSPAGQLLFKYHLQKSPFGSVVPDDLSVIGLQDNTGNFAFLKPGGIFLNSEGDTINNSKKDHVQSTGGSHQSVVGGHSFHHAKGNTVNVPGSHDSTAVQSASAIQGMVNDIHEQKKQAFESAEPDQVKCPVCAGKVNTQRASVLAGQILRTIEKYKILPWAPFNVEKLNKYLTMLLVPFMSETSNLSLTGGKSCGHPNCEGGVMKTNGNNFQQANNIAQQQLQEKQSEITKHEQNLSPNANVHHFSGGLHIRAGLVKNNIIPYGIGLSVPFPTGLNCKGKKELGIEQEGAMKDMLHHIGVDSTPGGEIFLDASNKFTVSAGAPGIEIQTTGHTAIHAGSVDLLSTHGEMIVASNGLTTLKGKNIKLDANDRSGDSAILFDAKRTHVTGKLSVNGDLNVKGTIILDGAVATPTLITRSTQYQTEAASACDPVSHHPVYNSLPPFENGHQATVYNTFAETLHIINTVIDGLDYILSLEWLTNAVLKGINLVKINTPVANEGLPAGFAMTGYDYFLLSPITVTTDTGPGIVDPGFMPVWSFPHNHPQISGGHTHFHEHPACVSYDGMEGYLSNRPNGSHVPTPPPEPSGTSPGPNSVGGGCLVGGASFANAQNRANNAIQARNAAYGLPAEAFTGNFVPVTAQFNPDGSIVGVTPSTQYNC